MVLYGILQAHRRFTAPALAPVLSSLVVIAAYLAFVPLADLFERDKVNGTILGHPLDRNKNLF